MALYGAPIWVDALSRSNVRLLRRPQRVIAARACRAYRTASFEAVTLLAGDPPWELQGRVLAEVHARRAAARASGADFVAGRVRADCQIALLRDWRSALEQPGAGRNTIEAIRPVLDEWVSRGRGTLTYRTCQVLTGHGCFGEYLHKVARREETPACHHCGAAADTVRHTVEECPAWGTQRSALVALLGGDLSLPAIVRQAVGSDTNWGAMTAFCEAVMSQKEAAERVREDDPLAAPLRRCRRGVRRRRYADLLPLPPPTT